MPNPLSRIKPLSNPFSKDWQKAKQNAWKFVNQDVYVQWRSFLLLMTSFLVVYKYFPVAASTMVILFERSKVDHGLSQKAMDGAPLFLTIGITRGTLCQLHAVQGCCDRHKHTDSLKRFVLLSPNHQNWCRSLSCTLLQPMPHKSGHSGHGSGTPLPIWHKGRRGS